MHRKVIWILLIISELTLGMCLDFGFNRIVQNCDNFYGGSYFSSIFRYFGIMSLLYFFSVFFIGIIGSIIMHKTSNLKTAILFSIVFWIVGLVIYATTYSYFSYELHWYVINNYIILLGIALGFNLGLASKIKI